MAKKNKKKQHPPSPPRKHSGSQLVIFCLSTSRDLESFYKCVKVVYMYCIQGTFNMVRNFFSNFPMKLKNTSNLHVGLKRQQHVLLKTVTLILDN